MNNEIRSFGIQISHWNGEVSLWDIHKPRGQGRVQGTREHQIQMFCQNRTFRTKKMFCTVLFWQNILKCSFFVPRNIFKTTENMQIHHDHIIFALNFFLNFQSPKLFTSLEIFILKTLLILDFLPYHYITLQFLFKQ